MKHNLNFTCHHLCHFLPPMMTSKIKNMLKYLKNINLIFLDYERSNKIERFVRILSARTQIGCIEWYVILNIYKENILHYFINFRERYYITNFKNAEYDPN